MKKILTLLIVAATLHIAQAQDEALFSHYTINPQLINPAATGFNEKHNINMNIRASWAGFPGTPKTYALSYNGPVSDKLGLGALLVSENIANIARYRAQLSYAFRYKFEQVKMSIGLSTEFHQVRLANSVLTNPFVDGRDDLLNDAINGARDFDASIGIMGTFKEDLFFGVSAPGMIRSRLSGIDNGQGNETKLFQYWTLMVGNVFDLKSLKCKLIPSIALKQVRTAPFYVDLNLLAYFLDDKLATGITYRGGTEGAANFLLGTKLNALGIYYSFDVSFQQFQRYNTGSHEVTINFTLDKPKKAQPVKRKGRK